MDYQRGSRRFGLYLLERKAILWSVFASFALSAYVSLFELFIPTSVSMTGDMWLDLCFAVILPALGSAIVFDISASTVARTFLP